MQLTQDERTQLSKTFSCAVEELDAKLLPYGEAATEEYVRMILGQRVLTRGQDIREYRLHLLIRRVFDGKLPTEQQISDLFQTTTTQSRALLRAVISKYKYELQTEIEKTLIGVLTSAKQDEKSKRWSVTVDSENVIEALNRQLAAIDGTLPPIIRVRNMTTTYEIPNSSYENLKNVENAV